jgi:two-component system copper resistance phosphate regulon response regulator CusR
VRILIIEDEQKTYSYLSTGLTEQGFVVDIAKTGEDGLHLALHSDYDLVILDIMLPERDGWSVLANLRGQGKQTPVLVLTARDAVSDRVKGFNLGADDYLIKPFAFSELVARLQNMLRRAPGRPNSIICVGGLDLDISRQRATREGKKLDLTAMEFRLLSLLALRAGQVLSRTYIAEQVWDMNFDFDSNVVDVHIRRLRAKVDDPFPSRLIQTVRGVGYVLEEPRE